LACAAIIEMTPVPGWSLDFASELLVYREGFVGEIAYPTTPDVDEIGGGGLIGLGFVYGTSDPVLTGTVATASLVAGGGGVAGVAFVGGAFGSESNGIRGGFANLALPTDSFAISGVGGVYDTGPLGSAVRVELEISRNALGVSSGVLVAKERDEDANTESFLLSFLTAAESAAVAAGSTFVLDVLADRVAGTVSASIDIPGFPTRTAGPLPLTVLGGSELNGASQFLASGETVALDFADLAVYRAFSTSFVVDTNVDEVDAVIGDTDCEAASTFCSLRAAIQESNAITGPGEIIVPSDTYILALSGINEDAAATGDLDITDDLVLRGAGRDTTLIDGGGIDRVFELRGILPDVEAQLLDVTIRNGAAVSAGNSTGGGIENFGSLTLLRCIISQNQANLAGGILNRGTLVMDDCVVSGNHALDLGFTSPRAGGLASASSSAGGPAPTAVIRNSSIVDNTGPIEGGAEFGNCASALVENTTISGNANTQLRIFNCDVVLQHVTIVGGPTTGISAASFAGTNTLEFANTSIDGTPACDLSVSLPVLTIYSGNNASNDTSCNFSSVGSFEGLPLGLLPLATIGNSRAHHPLGGSLLIDSADMGFCLAEDQVGTARPLDGNSSGTAECDIGAIEVPEPSAWFLIISGVGMLVKLGRVRFHVPDAGLDTSA
jgi:hypothetical protein